MKIYKVKDYEAMSRLAANIIGAQITLKPDSVLGLATGSTPEGTYKVLVERYNAGDLDFSQIQSVNLDEYKGLSGDNDQSYRYFMNKHLFSKVNIDLSKTHVPNGLAEDPEKACKEYDELVASLGGADLQLLGIGGNGHIGFNEPSDSFAKGTHCVALEKSTIEANSRFFASIDDVPTHAYSMGIKTIMSAKKILLLASGENKAEAINATINGPITPKVPGSILQLHPDVTIIADEAAMSKTTL